MRPSAQCKREAKQAHIGSSPLAASIKCRRSVALRYFRPPVDPYKLIPARACGRIGASRETEWPILLRHGNLRRSALSCVGDEDGCNFRIHLYVQNQGIFRILKQYRPLCFNVDIDDNSAILVSTPKQSELNSSAAPNAAETATFKYRAFLSYSHADTGWARVAASRARKPIASTRTSLAAKRAHGPVPKTLRPRLSRP